MLPIVLSAEPPLTQFWGILEYKPQWTLSLKGWLILGTFLSIGFWFFMTNINAFLLKSKPLKEADVLLVEGWLLDSAVKGAFTEYQKGNYKLIITAGLPIERSAFLSHYKSLADLAKANLIKMGVEPQKIISITGEWVETDRTAAMAYAVQKWLENSDLSIQSINLYSYDIHTRRSYLVYRKLLKSNIQLGAIAYYSPHYNHQKWWTSSHGLKTMINEIISYFYTRLIWVYFK